MLLPKGEFLYRRGLFPWDIGEFAHSINFRLGGEQAVVLKWDKLPDGHLLLNQKTWRFLTSIPGWKHSPRGMPAKFNAREPSQDTSPGPARQIRRFNNLTLAGERDGADTAILESQTSV